jgi:hypothetical protein
MSVQNKPKAIDGDSGMLWPGEITVKTQAAMDLVRVAKATGIFGRLVNLVSGDCDTLAGDATDSPRLGERRNDTWRGQGKDSGCEDLTDASDDGESNSLARTVQEKWSRVLREMKRKRRPK